MLFRRNGMGLLVLTVSLVGSLDASPEQDVGAPVQVQVPLIFKALTFDRNLTRPGDGAIVFGILYQGRYRTSIIVKDEAIAAIRQFAGVLAPRLVRSVPIDLDEGDLETALDRVKPTVLYVAPLRAVRIPEIAATTRERGISTVTGVPLYVEGGLAMGIGLRGDRPELVVNLAAARAEGADYESQFLRLARLVESSKP